MGLRELARQLDVKNPQTIKFHLAKLHQEGLLPFAERPTTRIESERLGGSALIRIPIMGLVSAGPATQYASNDVKGYLRISSALLESRNYKELFALQVVGTSMNKAKLNGKPINNGDFAIIDAAKRSPKDGDYVVAVVDGLSNIKKLHLDNAHNQVVLLSESTDDYQPIFVHEDDNRDGLISGTVVQVIHTPSY